MRFSCCWNAFGHFAQNQCSPLEALGFGASGKQVASAFDKPLPLFWNLLDVPPSPSTKGSYSHSLCPGLQDPLTTAQHRGGVGWSSFFLTLFCFSPELSTNEVYSPIQQKVLAFAFILTVQPLTLDILGSPKGPTLLGHRPGWKGVPSQEDQAPTVSVQMSYSVLLSSMN